MTQIRFGSTTYALAYFASEGANHLFTILAVAEIYRIALEAHPGLANFGRATIYTATLLAVVIAATVGFVDRAVPFGQSTTLHQILVVDRSLDVVIVVFLILTAIFITWFPVQMARNTAVSITGFTVFYLVRAGGLLAANLLPQAHLGAINDGLLGLGSIVIAAWALAVRSEKAEDRRVTGHFWDPAALDRLTAELNTINAALVRLGRN